MELTTLQDKAKWNEFMESFPRASTGVPRSTFIQAYEWIDFQKALGNEAFPFAVIENNEIKALAGAVVINAKRGKYLYIRNGPVLDWNNRSLVEFTLNNLKQFAKSKGLWFIRLSPLIEVGSEEEKIYTSLGGRLNPMHDVDALDAWVLDVRPEEEEILKAAKKKNRYEIRKSLSTGEEGLNLEVEITNDLNKIPEFYEILKDTVKRQDWNAYSLDYITKEFEEFARDNRATLVLVKKDSKSIAGGVFIHFANQTSYHYGASLSEYKSIPGPYRVIWEAIREAKRRGIEYLNFWGIAPENRPNHPWIGLSKFKMKFPGFAVRWSHSLDFLISPMYIVTNAYERFDNKRKGY